MSAASSSSATDNRTAMIEQAFRLEYMTLAWMMLETGVAIGSGIAAGSQGFHRIRYYGLLTGPTTRQQHRAYPRAPRSSTHPDRRHQGRHHEPEEPKAPEHPCPCCGNRMSIIETFLPGQQPTYRPTPLPAKIRIDTS
jgi:hypothetical protein